MSDQKIDAAKGKPPLGLVPSSALTGVARVFQYGAKKYQPGNFHLATLDDGAGERYVSGALRHLAAMQLPNGLYTPESLAALDPESGLPHLDHCICGLVMLRSIMVKCGALPADPGVGKDPPPRLTDEQIDADYREQSCGPWEYNPVKVTQEHDDKSWESWNGQANVSGVRL